MVCYAKRRGNMKRKWILSALFCWGGLFSCSNPVKENDPVIPGLVLNALERADITLLAGAFSNRKISRISVDRTRYFGYSYPQDVQANDFTGIVQFDSVYTDTDKISYQDLQFYNRHWHKFSTDGLPDSGRVFVNDWYSSQDLFYPTEKTVFKLDSFTIIAEFSGTLNKTQIAEYLHEIAAIQPGLLDTNQQKIIADFSMPEVSSIGSSTIHDTTDIDVQCGDWMSTYRFKFVENEFKEVSIRTIGF
jgi:hypothetical protein